MYDTHRAGYVPDEQSSSLAPGTGLTFMQVDASCFLSLGSSKMIKVQVNSRVREELRPGLGWVSQENLWTPDVNLRMLSLLAVSNGVRAHEIRI